MAEPARQRRAARDRRAAGDDPRRGCSATTIGLTGTKVACNEGHCGACTVLVDGTPTLSCITLAHRLGGREVTTIEGLRDHPMVRSFVRADAVQCGLLHAGADRVGGRARRALARPEPRGDPPPHGREHLPLRHLSEDRGGDTHVARLIRTEKEVEGRFEEVWLVVEEDALEQWPAGPREVVGRPAARVDGLARARGEALFTGDIRLPGMLHAAVLRSPHPRARVTRIDLSAALEAPGVRAAVGPGDIPALTDEPGYEGQAVAAVCADTFDQAAEAVRAGRGRVGAARAAARPRRGGRPRLAARNAGAAIAATSSRGLPRPTRSSRRPTAPRSCCTTRWRPTSRCAAGWARSSRCTSRRSTSGASATSSPRGSGWTPTASGSSATTWAAGSARRTGRTTTASSAPSSRAGRVVPCAAR